MRTGLVLGPVERIGRFDYRVNVSLRDTVSIPRKSILRVFVIGSGDVFNKKQKKCHASACLGAQGPIELNGRFERIKRSYQLLPAPKRPSGVDYDCRSSTRHRVQATNR